MPFSNLQIRFQTARSLPAPYANFYTLAARPAFKDFLQVDFAITYPDREDIDEDELIAEGFTPTDDFSWSGRLPNTWQKAVAGLIMKTKLQSVDEEELDEDTDFWELTVQQLDGRTEQGRPENVDDWQYLMQELMQAAYELANKERPFELTYYDYGRNESLETRLTASFADRVIKVQSTQNRQNRSKTLPWQELQRIMNAIYSVDFDPESALYQPPRRDGQWLNLGSDEWYAIEDYPALTELFRTLI